MCFLECYKNWRKKKSETKIQEVAAQKEVENNVENLKVSIDRAQLIEPLPKGGEFHVRVKDSEDNEFHDPRGQMAMQEPVRVKHIVRFHNS